MALTATIYKFDIDLADSDRRVYESIAVQAAQHPSESDERLVARVLAYALEYADGIAFSPGGVSEPDDPAIAVRDLTGAIRVWIDIGSPDAARLHKASKAVPRVVVYTHKDPGRLIANLAGERIHRASSLEIYALAPSLVDALAARLDRMAFTMSVADQEVFLSIGTETLNGAIVRHRLPASD
ncbi:MAG TPA: YaeQ family protein [Vicinamibacterales bacterium]|nr:YaeQ family protein [Vicinamibacterales bacterium]